MGGKILRRIKKDLENRSRTSKKIVFFFDYDGTLTPIRKKPHLATLSKDTRLILNKLSKKKNSEVFIISGRSLKDVKSLVGLKNISYIGNHGIEFEAPRFKYVHPKARVLKPSIQKSFKILKSALKKYKGVFVENKTYTLSLHYRLANPKDFPQIKNTFEGAVKPLKKTKKIKITEGKKVFEVRPNIKWDKGKSVKWVLKKIKTKKNLPICIGDDITDEDAFKVIGKKGLTILVSKKKRKTKAQYRLDSPNEVKKILKWCINEPLD